MLTAKELTRERRLIEASQRDPSRFADLYERYFDRIYAFALTRTGNRTVAEDVTAETFRSAFQNLSGFEWRGVPFSAWLFRIAANAATNLQQRERRQSQLDSLGDEPAESWEAHFIEVEERSEVFGLVARLPKDQRQVIVMRFGQERSIKEIAQTLGRSEGAVKQLQFRALHAMRAWVEKSDD